RPEKAGRGGGKRGGKPAEETGEIELTAEDEKKPASGPKKGWKKKAAAVLATALIILMAAYGLQNLQPTGEGAVAANFNVPATIVAGHPLVLSGMNSTGDITNYTWSFGDTGQYHYGAEQEHVYKTPGHRTITLTVSNGGGARDTTTSQIEVLPLTVTVPPDRYGETVAYDTNTRIVADNPAGIATFNFSAGPGEQSITILSIDVWMNGTTTSAITDGGSMEDCFLQTRQTVNVSSHQDLLVDGRVLTSSGRGAVNGPMSIWESTFSEMGNKTPIQTFLNSKGDFHLSVGSIDEDLMSKDRITAYPDPNQGSQELSADKLRSNGTFSSGEKDVRDMGGIRYIWDAVRAESVHLSTDGRRIPALVLEITLSSEDMTQRGLTRFAMELWISAETSFPVHTALGTTQISGGNTTTVDAVSSAKSITPGTATVAYLGSPPTFHTNWGQKQPALAPEFVVNWQYIPPHNNTSISGSDAIPGDFTAQDAMNLAWTNTPLGTYLSGRPNAYCVSSRYGVSAGAGGLVEWQWWNMTFHGGGGDDLVVNVTRQMPTNSYGYEHWYASQENWPHKSEISPVLTYKGAQLIMKQQDEFHDHAFIFATDTFDVKNGEFGTEANISLPAGPPTNSMLLSAKVDYGYVMEHAKSTLAGNNEYARAAINAETGQFIYVWIHEDNAPGMPF
ncbi:MAG: PKD domain-containing protein, partial [Candidatus Thermoplasmatota archaeon]|nr:PKD domain-containing protein [Candidatus Thermoplasmatota archaeon]